jgi:hypothetical protein
VSIRLLRVSQKRVSSGKGVFCCLRTGNTEAELFGCEVDQDGLLLGPRLCLPMQEDKGRHT